jgi:hypothetical protein
MVFAVTGTEDIFRIVYNNSIVWNIFDTHTWLHVEFVSNVVEVGISANSEDLFQYKSSATASTSG